MIEAYKMAFEELLSKNRELTLKFSKSTYILFKIIFIIHLVDGDGS